MNSYLSIFEQIQKRNLPADILEVLFDELKQHYSWIVPSLPAIKLLKEHLPIVELGAGNGYWASLVAGKFDIYTAIDMHPLSEQHSHFPVEIGGASMLKQFGTETTLFICCPQYRSHMMLEALQCFQGTNLIYAGDHDFGLQFGDELVEELEKNWLQVSCMPLPNWTKATNNEMSVWRKKV